VSHPHPLLVASAWLDGWYVLEGGGNRASVEGTATEWREVADALRSGKGGAHFKRLAAHKSGDTWAFWSPRNATSESDRALVAVKHGPALADHIDKVLAAYEAGASVEEGK
jgi:hypothetical protein